MKLPYQTDQQFVFSDEVGALGADKERYDYWLNKLVEKAPALYQSPQREAAPMLSIPSKTDDLKEIEEIAGHIIAGYKTLVVVGMGGSSLSGEVLSFLKKPDTPKVHFVDNIDPKTLETLCVTLPWQDTAFLIISKSGGTVETLAQTSVLLRAAKEKLGEHHFASHFTVISITNDNPLHHVAKAHNIRVVAHDPDLGGRFSILSAVGLIPAAVMGLDVKALRKGAEMVRDYHFSDEMKNAPAIQGAALQLALIEKKTRQHVLMHYSDGLQGLALWYRQCWGESLGKCDNATSPVIARGATDQHSQLQLYLDGPKDKFYSLVMQDCRGKGAKIDFDDLKDERFAFLSGHTVGDLMDAEQRGTVDTLIQRGCPVRTITIKTFDELVLGGLLMHFALEIMFTAALLGIDAFDQPAVEDAKKIAMRYLSGENDSARKRA